MSTTSNQRIGVLRETFPLEKRVATVPDVVEKLIKLGFGVCIESGAGEAANFSDDAYQPRAPKCCPMLPPSGLRPISSSRCGLPPRRRWSSCMKARSCWTLSGPPRTPI